MPKPKASARSVGAEVLRKLLDKGADSPVLDARLEYMNAEAIAKYVRGLVGVERVYPNMLPTQASLRWSTTDPPIVNFPKHSVDQCRRCIRRKDEGSYAQGDWCPYAVREIFLPDEGWYWVHCDEEAVEARLCAAYSGDQGDLDAFNNGWDIHTLRACGVFGWPLPPVKTKALHRDPSCAEWRAIMDWSGDEDRRRHITKTVGYALQYGIDERAALESNELYKMGLTRESILKFARSYLRSKPQMVAKKRAVFEECATTKQSRTFLGHRRRLYGSIEDRMKEGWNHKIQGGNSGMMNLNVIAIDAAATDCYEGDHHLVFQAHDGLTWAFEENRYHKTEHEAVGLMRKYMERTWDVDGYAMKVPCTWEVIRADGSVEHVK